MSTKPPFVGWAPHYQAELVGAAWYVEKECLFVCQTDVTRATGEGATILCDWMDRCLSEDASRIDAAGGLAIVHDWRSIDGYDTEARQVMVNRIKQRKKGYARSTNVVVQASPIMKMGLQVANVTLAMLGGSSIRIFHDISGVMGLLRGVGPGPAPRWNR